MTGHRRGGPQPGAATAALLAALSDAEPRHMTQDAIAVESLQTRQQLEALADRLDWVHASWSVGSGLITSSTGLSTEDVRRAADVVRAASRHGYPRPPLEALGHEADAIPTARTADPSTSHDARPLLVKRGNMLGRLLVGFLTFERKVNALRDAQGVSGPDTIGAPYDRTLTSEELAKRLGVERTEYAKRCSDLAALGLIRVARDADGHERTRSGDSGRQRLVFELTDDGRARALALS